VLTASSPVSLLRLLVVLALILLVRWRWHPAFVLALGAASGMLGWVP